ncbi:unknown similar to AMEV071 [Choristoneura rosaceana entomopoxvirus 'L']|uniref:Entry-fusion complex protein OPG086 n=1 Tax=Choristoneura rosaceana entomopoxvirus 'L' TaxID=1293539 RepID=A0ABM9QKE7_9POXV|nr:unknown similar to AMEV071 [Choristoneura rosaceana entomopoxvirus 'L']CCU55995.1 unknown similar to AMEV071 [Choristoneura rosaceana entomopoxvirus 'L']
MLFSWIINIIIIVCFIISLILLYYPLNIYELMSFSTNYDPIINVTNKFNNNTLKQIYIFASKNVIYKKQGIITYDLLNNKITIRTNGETRTFDINTDQNKYIPMILLAT